MTNYSETESNNAKKMEHLISTYLNEYSNQLDSFLLLEDENIYYVSKKNGKNSDLFGSLTS